MKHNRITVAPGSPYEGRNCPVTKQRIAIGTSVVICPEHDWALAEIVFQENPRCPICQQEVLLPAVSGKSPLPKPFPGGSSGRYVSSVSRTAIIAIIASIVSVLVISAIVMFAVISGVVRIGGNPASTVPIEETTTQVQVITAVVTRVVPASSSSKPTLADGTGNVAHPMLLPRSAWGARSPGSGMWSQTPMRIVLTHEESSSPCCNGNVEERIQANERIHRDRGWADIGWHYIIVPDGRIFAGRDPSYQADSSYASVNPNYPLVGTIVVGILGNYNLQTPTDTSKAAIIDLLAWLCQEYKISSSEIYNLRDLAPVHVDARMGRTTSPGDNMPESSYFRNAVQALTGR